jgi:hypothetical protein
VQSCRAPGLLHSRESVHNFFCARARIQAPEGCGGAGAGRTGFGEGEDARRDLSGVLLAFPLESSLDAGHEQGGEANSQKGHDGDSSSCAVYAFLPVYSAGLKFVVHADFELVASRQNLRHDSAKNERLRAAVAHAFVAAFASARARNRSRSGASGQDEVEGETSRILRGGLHRYLPTESAITCPFWKPVAYQVRELLRQRECIETESGTVRRPPEVYIRSRDLPVEVLSSEDLLAATGFEFARQKPRGEHGEVEELLKLGCRKFTASVLLDCLESGKLTPALVQRPQEWYWRTFAFLLEHLHAERVLERLFCIPIFRVSSCMPRTFVSEPEMAALCQSSVFLAVAPDLAADGALASGALRVLCDEVRRACVELPGTCVSLAEPCCCSSQV